MSDIKLQEGERVVLSSRRRGPAGYGSLVWFGIIFGALQVCGSCSMGFYYVAGVVDDMPLGMSLPSILTVLICLAGFVYFMIERRKPYYFLTNKRLIAKRFILSPLEMDVSNIGAAARRVVRLMRYGQIVREDTTNRIALGFYTGGARLIGPVEEAEELVTLLKCVIDHSVDLSCLPSTAGDPAPAYARKDLFLAMTTTAAGVPRGPLFVGPTKIVAFADAFFKSRQFQLLTIAGTVKPAEEIEEKMVDIAKNQNFGRAIIMDREGLGITLSGSSLRVGSDDKAVAFELHEGDRTRMQQYLKTSEAHPYR